VAAVRDALDRFRAQTSQTRDALAGIGDAQITARVEERDDVRWLLWRIATLRTQRRVELGQSLTALGWQQTEAQRILALARESHSELRSILLGVPDEAIDLEPAPGEWSARQALEHAHAVDERYMMATEYAVERMHSDQELPLQRPTDGQGRGDDERLAGRLSTVLSRMDARRDDVVERLAGIDAEDLSAPVIYRRDQVDVRYRLYLFAAHQREHIGQVVRTLQAVRYQQSEAQMILGQAEVAGGVIEGMLVGLPDELLTVTPPGGLPSVQDILTKTVAVDDGLTRSILSAVTVA
jgi:DinB superfamily